MMMSTWLTSVSSSRAWVAPTGHPIRVVRDKEDIVVVERKTDKGLLYLAYMVLQPIMVMLIICLSISPAHAEPPPFIHNGEPFFPIGLWSRPPGGDYDSARAELAGAGFNVLHRWYSLVTTATLDADHNYGLKDICWAYAWLGDVGTFGTAIENKINEIGNHPAFFLWDTRDEPYWNYALNPTGCGFTREGLTEGKEFVNARDPTHPVMCNFAPYDLTIGHPDITFEGYQLWTSVGNVFWTDRYPADGNYPNTDLTPVGYCCDQLQAIVGEGVPVGMILQGCGLGEWSGTPNPGSRPNLIEDRFLVYSSIIHGAKGILYYGTNHIEPTDQMWADIKTVAGELSSLHDVLCKGITTAGYSVQSANCEAIMKVYDGYRYLLVANRSSSTLNGVQISVTGQHSPSAEVLFESRTINTNMGSFSDNFVPWDTHVYRIPLQTVSVDMGTADNEQLLVHIQDGVPDGTTEPVTIGDRDARKNVDPATDYYFYFDASDQFAYQGNRPDLYMMIDYYDTGSGSLGMQYDSSDVAPFPDDIYKNGGTVTLDESNEWKQHMFHVTDAYFGNRQNGGADFRIAKYGGGDFYLDVVEISVESPLPGQAYNPSPDNLTMGVDKDADLSWNEPERATSYHVYFSATNPPVFHSNQLGVTFDPGTMDYLTQYYWRIDAANGFGTTQGQLWGFTTESYPGDFDEDLDVDQEDFGVFQACLSGDTRPYEAGCEDADLDTDGDVDLDDFVEFLSCMNGSNNLPGC
ncbi:MAG: hypothetical protein ACYTBZ_03340 [Planctomycetota bacterium]|jgi:hypothetical protein